MDMLYRFQKPQDKQRYFDGSVWHPYFAWTPVWVGDKNEWLTWVWKRAYNIERVHTVTLDFLSRRGLG